MKSKNSKVKYTSKTKKNNRLFRLDKDLKWIIEITIIAFILTFALSLFSEYSMSKVNLGLGILIVLFIILVGVIFDMIGISVTVADPKVFHSMATKKIKGAKTALVLMKNASKMSSFCNDVIGDICGILSGAATATIAILLAQSLDENSFWMTLLVTSVIAALTIGGKAIGKSFAINKANSILYQFAKVVSIFRKKGNK